MSMRFHLPGRRPPELTPPASDGQAGQVQETGAPAAPAAPDGGGEQPAVQSPAASRRPGDPWETGDSDDPLRTQAESVLDVIRRQGRERQRRRSLRKPPSSNSGPPKAA